jgi:hypothetical protein
MLLPALIGVVIELTFTRGVTRGVRVGVTGLGPYDTTVVEEGWSWDFSRAAVSSSRSMLRSCVQKPPVWEWVGDCVVAVGECECVVEWSERTSS